MMNNELISIIIPVYNSKEFLEKTIESIQRQTYSNYEAIFIDDASTDESINILEKNLNNKFKIIKLKKHKGVSFARNLGIRLARGNFLCFLDADDIWDKHKLEEQIKFIKENDYAFVYSSYRYINNLGDKASKKIEIPLELTYKKALLDTRILTITTMIDLRKIPKRYCYMPNIMHEDMATWWKILRKGYIAFGQNRVLAYCRKSKKSRSSNKLKSMYYRWNLYKNVEQLGKVQSIYCFVNYAINAIRKRSGKMKIYNSNNETLQVLISTQNMQKDEDINKLIKRMNLKTNYLLINQIQTGIINIKNKNVITVQEKGLCKSRNLAVNNAQKGIILFADDDIKYKENYEKIILENYRKYPKADIICFYVRSKNKRRKLKRMHTGKIGYIRAMKIASFEMSCSKDSLLKNNLFFDENFGSGTMNKRGEEQILLYEAIRKKLKIIFVNKEIGEVAQEKSSWFSGYNADFFEEQGRIFKKMSPKYYKILCVQYAIRKYNLYHKEITLKKALNAMLK